MKKVVKIVIAVLLVAVIGFGGFIGFKSSQGILFDRNTVFIFRNDFNIAYDSFYR